MYLNIERSPKMAELAVSYKRKSKAGEQMRDPIEVAEYLRKIWDDRTLDLQEHFYMLCLDGAHRVIGWIRLYSGDFNSCNVDPKLAYAVALTCGASAVIFAHNHPSGDTEPSPSDISTAKKLHEAGKLLNVRVLDHVILTRQGYNSHCETDWRIN